VITDQSAARVAVYIISFGMCLDSLEFLAARHEYERGVYSPPIMARVIGQSERRRRLHEYPTPLTIPAAQIAFSLSAVAIPGARAASVGALLALHVVRLRLFPLGLSGFDQMNTVVLVGLLLALAFPNTLLASAGLTFIAAQACLGDWCLSGGSVRPSSKT
jgi:hypothetical protein